MPGKSVEHHSTGFANQPKYVPYAIAKDGTRDSSPLRVLLFQKQRSERDQIRNILKQAHLDFHTTEHPNEAFRILGERLHSKWVIISSMDPAGLDCLPFAMELHDAWRSHCNYQMILTSEIITVDLALCALKVGIVDFLLKPYRNDQILESVSKCIARFNNSYSPLFQNEPEPYSLTINEDGRHVPCENKPHSSPLDMALEQIRLLNIKNQSSLRILRDDATWGIFLEIYVLQKKGQPTAISSLCYGTELPMATALRKINALIETALVEKKLDPTDGRRHFVYLTDKGLQFLEGLLTHGRYGNGHDKSVIRSSLS